MRKRHILTADEFIAQGTTAGAIMSIAVANPAARTELEDIAWLVSQKTGQSLQIPGSVNEARMTSRPRKPANDNRPARQARRRAA